MQNLQEIKENADCKRDIKEDKNGLACKNSALESCSGGDDGEGLWSDARYLQIERKPKSDNARQ